MDFAMTEQDEAFRAELRSWLDANLPDFAQSGEIGDETQADRRTMARRQAWQRRLHEGHWAAINWPKSWGGREATVSQNTIYSEEMAKAKSPGIYNANGIWQIGPMILRWGTDEQQQRWLPGILSANEHWCQGFTEPEAGSDLANLRTLAVRDGDEYLVNGRKIWISTAHLAKWGLFLLRTDPTAIERGAKHEGITALIVDMELPGIEVNVIRDLTGGELFCEVLFDNARVPVSYRLGDEGRGWDVAMGTLANERVGTAGLSVSMRIELDNLIATARKQNPEALEDPEHPGPHRPSLDTARAHAAPQRESALQDLEGREELARGAVGKAPVELPLTDDRRARGRRPRADGGSRQGRAGRCRQGALGVQLRVAAVHVDRCRHDRGAEEHHLGSRHQDAQALRARGARSPNRRLPQAPADSTARRTAVNRSSVVTPIIASAWWTSGPSNTDAMRDRSSVSSSDRAPTSATATRSITSGGPTCMSPASIAATTIPSPSMATPARQSLRPLWLAKPTRLRRRSGGPEAIGGDALDPVFGRDLGHAATEALTLLVGERSGLPSDPRRIERSQDGVAEVLVTHGTARDLLGCDHVFAEVLDDLVLELLVGDPRDGQVEVEVGFAQVHETADAVARDDVLGGECAELASVYAKVAGAFELHGGETRGGPENREPTAGSAPADRRAIRR